MYVRLPLSPVLSHSSVLPSFVIFLKFFESLIVSDGALFPGYQWKVEGGGGANHASVDGLLRLSGKHFSAMTTSRKMFLSAGTQLFPETGSGCYSEADRMEPWNWSQTLLNSDVSLPEDQNQNFVTNNRKMRGSTEMHPSDPRKKLWRPRKRSASSRETRCKRTTKTRCGYSPNTLKASLKRYRYPPDPLWVPPKHAVDHTKTCCKYPPDPLRDRYGTGVPTVGPAEIRA